MQSQHSAAIRTMAAFLLLAVFIALQGLTEEPGAQAMQADPSNEDGGCTPWTLVSAFNPRTHHYLNDVDALAPDDVWAVGEYYDENNYTPDTALAMHWDGTQWSILPTPPTGQRGRLLGVEMVATNDVWAVGLQYPGGAYVPLVLHWNGVQWSEVATPTQPGGLELRDVVALAPNDIWAVGANDGFHSTIAMHWNGTQWSIVPTPNGGGFSDDNVLEAVTAISPTDIWAVGYIYPKGGTPRTLAIHWNGTQWTLVTTPNPGNYSRSLHGVAAVASNDVWAVGSYSPDFGTNHYPLFLRWNGSQWLHVVGPEFPDYNILRDVHAVSASEVWAVGTNAPCNFCGFDTLIMRWDGTQWTMDTSPNGFRDFNRLYGVTAASPGEMWAVGFSDNAAFPYTSDTLIMRRICETGGTPTVTRTGTPIPPTNTATTPTSAPTGTAPLPTATQGAASMTPTSGAGTQTVVAGTATRTATLPAITATPIATGTTAPDRK